MRLFLSPTDQDWFDFLTASGPLPEVNFWQPSGGRNFRALEVGEPFLFKLKAPHNAIGGFGHFARFARLPAWLAWESFGIGNGAPDYPVMQRRIEKYRKARVEEDSLRDDIGCILLAQPVFLPRDLWIPQPERWKPQTVAGAGYSSDEADIAWLWAECLERARSITPPVPVLQDPEFDRRYGTPSLVAPRLGQGIFRIGVLDAYGRACAVSGEHSLPVLEAAHIQPYADGGSHAISNGLLLRSDMHRLFDKGYVTVTPDRRVEVSGRLREDFSNGSTYYPFHGARIREPQRTQERPSEDALRWHNENVYLG